MVFRAYLVSLGWLQSLEQNTLRRSVAVGTEDIQRAAVEAWTPIEHPIPVVPIGPGQNVMYLDILQDRPNPGFVDLRRPFELRALLRRPGRTAGRSHLPLVHHGRTPQIRFWSIGYRIVVVLVGVIHQHSRRKREARV